MKVVSNSTIHAGRKTAPKFLTVLLATSSFIALAWLSGTAVRSRAASFTAGEPEPRGQRLSDRGATKLRTLLNVAKLAAVGDERLTSFADDAQELYNSTDQSLVWVENRRPTAQAREILIRLQHAEEKGLDPEDYDGRFGGVRFAPPEIPRHPSESDLIRFDVVLMLGTVRYLSDLHCGRANPKSPLFAMELRGKTLDLPSFIREELVYAKDPRAVLESVEPQFLGYRRSLVGLRSYRDFQQKDDGAILPEVSHPIGPGVPYAGLRRLRNLLQLLKDLPDAQSLSSAGYDDEVARAVKRFQERHGLEPSGLLDQPTVHELNVPISQRVAQLELTLERWRWLPSTFTRPPVVVNIPEFRLHVVDEQHHIVSSMNVVVGRAYHHATPLFESEIKSVLFRPPWNVPLEIQRAELAPLIEKNSAYLAENSYDIVDSRGSRIEESTPTEETITRLRNGQLFLRQRPGEENSLGLVKFELPNPYDVYLHGTPAHDLFSKSRRDFSHGCVRVEDPVALAVWLLRDNPSWGEERVEAAMHGSETLRVTLAKAVPVWIVYATAVVLEDGRVRFFKDVYGQDAALEQELARERSVATAGE
jgi:murein L,D-transpeptidase YcbB/YkuD